MRAWTKANFNIYFGNTVLYAVATTIIELIKSSTCGYVLARYDFPGRKLLYGLIVGTLFIPIASIIIPQFVLIKGLGLLNTRAGVILYPLPGLLRARTGRRGEGINRAFASAFVVFFSSLSSFPAIGVSACLW
ncbi:MAG: hypothetical protein U9R25_10345 [Chloroflexota bacterium]|nr:hypothetical protein [Chloroflexota bacterium]